MTFTLFTFLFWFVVAFFGSTVVIQPDWVSQHGLWPTWARWLSGLIVVAMLFVEYLIIEAEFAEGLAMQDPLPIPNE